MIESMGNTAAPRPETLSAEDGANKSRCEVCHNDYDKTFEVVMAGARHTFDSFECAIHALAPACVHCGCKIVGHGLESNGKFFCCDNCAEMSGETRLRDRA
jgi:hypothetical protein